MHVHTASGSGQWLGVDWASIGLVFVASLIATVVIVASFALATRLLAVGAPDIRMPDGADPDGPDAVAAPRTSARPVPATIGAWVFYAVGISATVYGIYLIIPAFHH
ncbi:hypothetical protein [uncultured Microbacterium sp.]|uniref:hypothetical protein n=1 Tax=uncultured Microbacterium sp. TaxID=191216 RepID=UPI0035CA57AC